MGQGTPWSRTPHGTRPLLHPCPLPLPHRVSPHTGGSQQRDLEGCQPRCTAVHGEGLGHSGPDAGAQPWTRTLHLAGVHHVLHRHPERAPCGSRQGSARAGGQRGHGVSMGTAWGLHGHGVNVAIGSMWVQGEHGHGVSMGTAQGQPVHGVNMGMGTARARAHRRDSMAMGSMCPWGQRGHRDTKAMAMGMAQARGQCGHRVSMAMGPDRGWGQHGLGVTTRWTWGQCSHGVTVGLDMASAQTPPPASTQEPISTPQPPWWVPQPPSCPRPPPSPQPPHAPGMG